MDRINGANTIDIGDGARGFRDRNAVDGLPGTEVTADFLNGVQEEILRVIEVSGFEPAVDDYSQLFKALALLDQTGGLFLCVAGGTANALTGGLAQAVVALTPGMGIRLIVTATSTASAPTLNLDGLGAKTIVRADGSTMPAGGLVAGSIHELRYDGDNWRDLTSDNFTASLGLSGYFRHNRTSWTLQWGQANIVSGVASITFPTAFSSVYSILVTNNAGSNPGSGVITSTGIATYSNSGFTMAGVQFAPTTAAANGLFFWAAVGIS